MKIRKRFEEKVAELVDVGAPNLWGHFKDGVLEACERCVGCRGRGGVKEVHGGGMKR